MQTFPSSRHPLIILGGGYTGRRLFERARTEGWNALCSSRQPSLRLSDIPVTHRIHFDLKQPETWGNVPSPAHIVWCFPACPVGLIQGFFETRDQKGARLIVLGSTSAYPSNGGKITEDHPPDTRLPRVQGEEFLRRTRGAIIIRLAGLYGPGRHVLDWIRKGKVRHTNRFVNLLHVEDAVGICLQAFHHAPVGSTYLASDGTPRKWSEIFSYAASKWQIRLPPVTKAANSGKHIDNRKMVKDLGYVIRYPDLYQALNRLESDENTTSKTFHRE